MPAAVKLKSGRILYLHKKPSPYPQHSHYLYYFSRDPTNAIDLPEGFEIVANSRNGFPTCRRIKK